MNVIELKDIIKVYGSQENELRALNHVNLTIKKGDSIAIMGTSGSGKSTLLNIIGTIDKATRGTYFLDNKNISDYSIKELASLRNKKIGFVMQDFALIPHYTTKQNIMLPLQYTSLSKQEKDEKVLNLIKKMKIENRANAFPEQMSGGEKQRVAIARALVNDADIILCDEPTGALDSRTTVEIMEILTSLNKSGKTIIIVSHNPKVAKYCNRSIFIEDGYLTE